MEAIKIEVTGNIARVTQKPTKLTSGTVGLPVEFTFDEQWDGLKKVAVFRAGDIKKTLDIPDGETTVPWEVMDQPKVWLSTGVYGINDDGTVVIPTIWANVSVIRSGVDLEGDDPTDPEAPIWKTLTESVEEAIDNANKAAEELREALENGEIVIPGGGLNYPMLLKESTWLGTTDKDTIEEVRFVESYTSTNYDGKWDAGVVAGEITAYREGNLVTVSANGKQKIKLNKGSGGNCFALMKKLKSIIGLDMIDVSESQNLRTFFSTCPELESVDLSTWVLNDTSKHGVKGFFLDCTKLRSVKMPRCIQAPSSTDGIFCGCSSLVDVEFGSCWNITNSDKTYPTFDGCDNLRRVVFGADTTIVPETSTALDSYVGLFEGCRNLVEVEFKGEITTIPGKTFSKCFNLERVTGLCNVTTIGDRAFIQTTKLKDIDLDPAKLTSIGESAFRFSSIEDCIIMDDLNPACTVGTVATRKSRWGAELGKVQDLTVPTVMLRVPHPTSQLRYPDVVFTKMEPPFDSTKPAQDVSIAIGGCTLVTLYHEWQCVKRGTNDEKQDFNAFWDMYVEDGYPKDWTSKKAEEIEKDLRSVIGLEADDYEKIKVVGAEQLKIIINRLNNGLPTQCYMRSANSSGAHAVLIIGGDAKTNRVAVLESALSSDPEIVWVKLEDMLSMNDSGGTNYAIVTTQLGEPAVNPNVIGNIESALDHIIAIQEALIGGAGV